MGFNMQNEVLASQWLAKEDVGAGMQVNIAGVTEERVGSDEERKFVMHFRGGFPKPMIMNKVNTRILVSLFGPLSDGWIGRDIEVYNDPTVGFGGQITGGVRVRAVGQPVPRPAAPMSPDEIRRAYEELNRQNEMASRTADDIPF